LASSIGVLYKKFDEEKACSSLDNEPDPDLSKENLEPIKPDACASPDVGKETPEVHIGNDGNTCPVLDTPELDAFQENLETDEPDGHPLLDSGKENIEDCQDNNEFFVVDKGIEISPTEPVKEEESFAKASKDASTVDSTFILDTAGLQGSFEDSFKHGDSLDEANDGCKEHAMVDESACEEDDFLTNELLQELESAINS
ncbi:EEIG1/EHBP1 amino-terminal domain protein, partial [Trifolium medium]|nr:EEIG1/EHBP1 amino-terminal domain protein [Trifolium medium]